MDDFFNKIGLSTAGKQVLHLWTYIKLHELCNYWVAKQYYNLLHSHQYHCLYCPHLDQTYFSKWMELKIFSLLKKTFKFEDICLNQSIYLKVE